MRTKTNEQFTKEVEELVGDEFVFLEDYINSTTKIKARHSVCGTEFRIRPNQFLANGRGCPECNPSRKLKREEVAEKVDKYTDGEFEFVGEYINATSGGYFRHKACGTVIQKIVNNSFKRDKTDCEVCHPEARTRPYTDEEFESKLRTELGCDYVLSGNCGGNQTRVNGGDSTGGELFSSDASAISRYPRCKRYTRASEGEHKLHPG